MFSELFRYPVFKEQDWVSALATDGPLGNVLLSQDPAVQVPSALKGLTVVFEMGTRGSPSPLSPNELLFI